MRYQNSMNRTFSHMLPAGFQPRTLGWYRSIAPPIISLRRPFYQYSIKYGSSNRATKVLTTYILHNVPLLLAFIYTICKYVCMYVVDSPITTLSTTKEHNKFSSLHMCAATACVPAYFCRIIWFHNKLPHCLISILLILKAH